jgi:TPR repeat protein
MSSLSAGRLAYGVLACIALLRVGVAEAGLSEGYWAFRIGDFERARIELSPLAAGGDGIAAYYLGLMYWEGKGVERDPAAAVSWISRAAQSGQSEAQLTLATAYALGEGAPRDYQLAAKWMAEAAERGNSDAQYYLGLYYRDGKGIVQSDVEAYTWIHRSVEYGVSHDRLLEALLYLGAAREWDRGMPQNLVEAYKWFALAAGYSLDEARIFEEAGRAMGALSTRMTASEMSRARRLAREWRDAKQRMYGSE